jgi:hypothetical protein
MLEMTQKHTFNLGKPLQTFQNMVQWRPEISFVKRDLSHSQMPQISSLRASTGISSDAGEATAPDVSNPRRISSTQTRRPSTSLTPPTVPAPFKFLPNPEPNDTERQKASLPLPAEEPDSEAKREDEKEISPTLFKTPIKSANSLRDTA